MATDAEIIASYRKHNYIEAKIARKVIKTLSASGNRVVRVGDAGEYDECGDDVAALALVGNLDFARLVTAGGGWVLIVNGNEWDALSDYTLDLEDVIEPINEWINERS